MSRYIDADALIDDLIHNRSFYPAMVASAIKNTPTADVVEVRHGYWKEVREFVFNLQMPVLMGYECSECGTFVECGLFRDKIFHKNYCGNCGAKMDGERK